MRCHKTHTETGADMVREKSDVLMVDERVIQRATKMKEFPNNAVMECRQREYSRLPLGGHLQVKGKGEDVKRPGERQLILNLARWDCHGEKDRQLPKTRPGGKETLLRPHALLRAIKTDDENSSFQSR